MIDLARTRLWQYPTYIGFHAFWFLARLFRSLFLQPFFLLSVGSDQGIYGPLRLTVIPVLCVVREDDVEMPVEGDLNDHSVGDCS